MPRHTENLKVLPFEVFLASPGKKSYKLQIIVTDWIISPKDINSNLWYL